jgi:Icc-related predicted phosphoesterase
LPLFGSSKSKPVRLCFVTDIHGSDRCFKKFINAGRFYDAQYLILGGDITGKTLVPIERTARGWDSSYSDHKYVDLSHVGKAELEQLIRDNGQYPVSGTKEELRHLFSEERRDQTFREAAVDGIRRWMQIAGDRLKGTGVRCFVTPGNDDAWDIDEPLQESDVVEFVEGKCVELDEKWEMITTGYSNLTPWHSPRELDEKALADRINGMFQEVQHPENVIAVLHPPPFSTELDQAPVIDSELRVKTSGGAVRMGPVGSTAVRDFILAKQPLLGLHGHVHESKASQRLGRTLCINPGSEYTSGVLSCAIVSLHDGKPPEFQFTVG